MLLLLLSALGIGVAHAFEPDHMAAVSTFVARRPSPREAALFGVRWALGHGFSLLLLGSVLYALRLAVESRQPFLFSSGVLERVVGVSLIGLGLWTLFTLWANMRGARTGEAAHDHSHLHGHHSHAHGEKLGSLGMGMLHGLAGTGAFVGQTAIALSQSYAFVLLYTLVFSVGVLGAMTFYAGVLGGTISWGGQRAQSFLHTARALIGAAVCVIGVCLLLNVELPGLFDHWVH